MPQAAALKFHDISPGRSLFKFIPSVWKADHRENNRPVHRLCTLMRKMGVQSVVVETLQPVQGTSGQIEHEIWRDKRALHAYFGSSVKTTIYRLTFSSTRLAGPADLRKASQQSSFLASAVIFNFNLPGEQWHSYIFAAIISTLKRSIQFKDDDGIRKQGLMPLLNNYAHCAKAFPCRITMDNGASLAFEIHGTFYCQQNKFTSVCFHASACMALNNLEGRVADLLYPEDLNRILGFDHAVRRISEGEELGTIQLEDLLDRLGSQYKLMDFVQKHPETNYSHRLYRYLESKCPSLLIFTVQDGFHIVPVLGHTLNSDLWNPEAEMAYSSQIGELKVRPTSAWVDHYIIHDDNFGMYYCLPVDSFLRRKIAANLPQKFETEEEGGEGKALDPFIPVHCLALFPEGLSCVSPASQCEWGSIKLLEEFLGEYPEGETTGSYWIDELLFSSHGNPGINPLVARTLLVRKTTYVDHLQQRDNDGRSFAAAEQAAILDGLPDVFWLTEISLPDIYTANKHKLVDVVFNRDAAMPEIESDDIAPEEKQARITKWIVQNWIQMRLPGYLLKNLPAGDAGAFTKLAVKSHFPLLTDIKEPDILDEW